MLQSMGFQNWTKGACLLLKLKAIPPTLEAFKENIKRAHFQACIWKAALIQEPLNLDPLKCGWIKHDLAKSFRAAPLPQDVPIAPAELLKTIQCMCSSDQPCSYLRCGCVSGQLPCSLFCKCGGSDSCCNQMTRNSMANYANDDEEHSDDEDNGDEDDD